MGSPTEEIILAECSDEEEFNKLGISLNSLWSPKLEEIEGLYKSIKANKIIQLDWKCPRRGDPNQGMEESAAEAESLAQLALSVKDSESDDFAFDMEEESPASLQPTKTGPIFKSKTSTKRKTTLAGILSNMERHRIIERQDSSPASGRVGETPPSGAGNTSNPSGDL